ncbi:MAG: hypothetical protein JRK53_14095 [Deltaproteobacteria bacterium]|nr:hypothetical protein [Deltaproteobacteria bacterium]
MGNAKSLFINACITALLIAGGIWVASSRMQADYDPVQDMLNRQTTILEDKLAQIEKVLEGIEPVVVTTQKGGPPGNEDLEEISRKLDTILAKIASIEVSARTSPSAGINPPPMPGLQAMPGGGQRPMRQRGGRTRWIDTLPEEKKAEVQEIFRENATAVRDRFEAERQGGAFDIERFKEIKEEQDLELNEALREILTEEEYDGFQKERSSRSRGFPGSLPPGR